MKWLIDYWWNLQRKYFIAFTSVQNTTQMSPDRGVKLNFVRGGWQNEKKCFYTRVKHTRFFLPPLSIFFPPPPLEHTIGSTDEVCTRFLQLKLNRSVFFDLSIPREGTRCKSSGGVNAPIVPPIGHHYHLKRNSSIIFIAFWIFKYPVSGIRFYPVSGTFWYPAG